MEYHNGKGNKATYALSTLPDQENILEIEESMTKYGDIKAISMISINWWEELHQVYNQDPQLQQLFNHYQ